ncbi:hypothetical protein BKA64DRAFT_717824 [Cadophora sp. MPI-SDFR-AT-0126]|nr:hypothetical protein BKA64DRAFT_717824 [Leotiomycetes sp. MPI-SDFR-AT-0126]
MSTERFTFPVRDPERIMRRRRRQALRRQAPATISPESDSVTDGIESESSDDESSTSPSGQAQTQPPPASTASIAPPVVVPTLTAILPPAQATLLTSSSSGRVVPTLTAILPPAQATLLTSKSITASTSVSTPPVDPNTSIQGNRNQPPPPSSVPVSSSAVVTSNTAISTSPVNVQPNGGLTSTFMVSTTATAFISSSASASATTKAPTPANALGETNDAQTTETPSKDNGLSKGVETVIIVISVGAVFAVLVYVGLMLYRRICQRKLENTTSFTNGTRSIWGGSDHSSSPGGPPQMAVVQSSGPLPTYIPPPARQQAPPPEENPFADPDPDPRRSALTNNAVDRQERLGRVRADLLAPRELTGGLMRSATQRQANMPEPNRGHMRSASGNNIASNATAISGVFPSNSGNSAWPTGRVDADTMPPNQRLDIEAGGQWDDSVTVARYSRADTEKSMPHYRTPSQWVSDQAKRNQGMTRLPG